MGGGKKNKVAMYLSIMSRKILSGFVTQDFERRGGEEARSEEARGGERRRGGEEARKQAACSPDTKSGMCVRILTLHFSAHKPYIMPTSELTALFGVQVLEWDVSVTST